MAPWQAARRGNASVPCARPSSAAFAAAHNGYYGERGRSLLPPPPLAGREPENWLGERPSEPPEGAFLESLPRAHSAFPERSRSPSLSLSRAPPNPCSFLRHPVDR